MISPTSSTTMSVPFLSAAACAATPARRRESGVGVVIGSQCRGRVRRSRARLPTGTRPSIGPPGAEAVPDLARRHVEARDRHPLHRPARARAARRAGRRPARPPRRCRGRGCRRAAARWACWPPRRRRGSGRARGAGPASDSSVSAVTEAVPRTISTSEASTPSTPSTAASHEQEAGGGVGDDLAPLLPGVAGHDEQHPVERRALRHSVATTTCPTCTGSKVPPYTPIRSGRGSATLRDSTGRPDAPLHPPLLVAKHCRHLGS